MMDVELNTPFQNNLYYNRENKFMSKPHYINNKKISALNNNNTNEINKLKNDLREKPYNKDYIKENQNNYDNSNINKDKDINYYLSQINYYIEVIKPFSYNNIDIKKLSFDIPLLIYIIVIILKFFFSRKLTVVYLWLLILLPIYAYILINKIIIEEYYINNIIKIKKIFYKNFFKIFFNGYILFIIGYLSTKIFNTALFRYKYLIQILYLIYSSFIAVKIFIVYVASVSLFDDKNNVRKNIKLTDGKKIFFIFFIVYSLISYIINL